jgi:hypothetical protein
MKAGSIAWRFEQELNRFSFNLHFVRDFEETQCSVPMGTNANAGEPV